jgi:hypothetical protein
MILRAWLAAWLLLTGASAGAIAWDAIHRLTGGAWGDVLASRWRTLRLLLPLAVVAGVPLLVDAQHLFPWTHESVEDARYWYVGRSALVWRFAGCFAAWALAWRLLVAAPAASLILWLFACGLFANDWIVALSPEWRSSVIGLTLALGQLLVAFAAAIVMRRPAQSSDHASLLFAACLGWAYLVGVDYLTAWIADLPYETAWYLPRMRMPWSAFAMGAIAFQFAIPFLLLLSRAAKARPGVLHAAAVSVLLGQACHVAWMVLP